MSKREYPDFPRVGVGAIVIKEGKVLMIKRAAKPNQNLWAIPGGMLELGETLQEGAEREIFEETGIRIKAGKPIYTFDFMEYDTDGQIHFHYIIIDVEATYLGGEITPADDALDACWMSPEDCLCRPLSKNTLKILQDLHFMT
ncbi:MAG: Bifunctional NMN adenylyltransferase/Nudix hydrolase [Syntrophus sp. SKADARSKE-3]|nr:Bifunctional NMN adenylyltransferase/Nudix hydrolase [Syntrophus sp. SKADARSKE-3]